MSQTNNTTNVEKLAPAIQEESKQDKSNTLIEDVLKLSIKSEESNITSPALLAWCSDVANNIRIIEIETKQNYVNFQGPQITAEGYWPHVKEIPNTKLLVSLNCRFDESNGGSDMANMAIFDISNKKAKKIYSLGKISGVIGESNAIFNARRNVLGAIPIGETTAYHLFDVRYSVEKSNYNVNLLKKAKWHSQYSTYEKNFIASFDFNPAGEHAATLDRDGICLISDINTDNYVFHRKLGKQEDRWGRCRWTTNPEEPLLFVKYDEEKLNVLDVEKKALCLKKPIHQKRRILWIDVCQSDGNLLATCDNDAIVTIFDKRTRKVVQSFDNIQREVIFCVRWSPGGDMLASAACDCTVKLWDFKTGKILYSEILPRLFASFEEDTNKARFVEKESSKETKDH